MIERIDLPSWVQAGSAVVIAILTIVLAKAATRYANDTKRMADLLHQQQERVLKEKSQEAASRLSYALLSLQRVMGRQGHQALEKLPDHFDRWQASFLTHAPMIRDGELSDRLDTFNTLFLTISLERPVATGTGQIPSPPQANRIRKAMHAIRLDLDAHRSERPLPERQLPHQSRVFDWIDAQAGASVSDFQEPAPPPVEPEEEEHRYTF